MAIPSAPQSSDPPSRQRPVLRAFAIVAVGVCLLIGALLLALQSAPARRFALNQLVALLASQQIELQTDEFRYNLFTLSIDVRNLRVGSAGSPELPVFATIGHSRIDLSLPQLLRGRYVVKSAVAEDVDLHYFVDADGRDNLPRLPADASEPRKPLSFLIDRLSIANARVRYENRPQRIAIVLPFPSVEITGNALTHRHQLLFESGNGEVHVHHDSAAIDRVTGLLDVGDDDLTIDRLQLAAAGSRAELAGVVRTFDAPELDLTMRMTIDAARAADILDVGDPIEGNIRIDATARGLLPASAIDARVSGSELRYRSLGGARVDAHVAYDAAARRADISSVRVQAPWGRVNASGQLALGSEGRSRLRAELAGIDAAAVMRGLNVEYVADTRVDGAFDVDWPGLDYFKTSGAGTATLTPSAGPATHRAIAVGGRLSARGNRGTIVAELQQITAAGAELNGRVQVVNQRTLQGELHASVSDVARTVSAAEAFAGRPRGSLLPSPVEGAAAIDARLGGTVDRPTAHAKVSAPSLSMRAANGIAIDADLGFTPAELTIARAEANWHDANTTLKGTVEWQGNQRVDLLFDAHAGDLEALARAATARAAPVSGAVGARGTIGGTVARPRGSVTLQGTDLMAFGEQLGALNADVTLAGRDITLSRLTIEKPQPEAAGRIGATGSYNLDRNSYTLELKSENVRLLGLTLPGGQRIRGNVQLEGYGAGSVRSPSGTVHIVIDSLEVDGRQLGRTVLAATAANRQASITASAERFNLDANAVVGLTRPWPATLTVRASDLDLERLPFDRQTPLAGYLRATVHAAGDLAEPARGRATANIESMAGSWNGHPFSVTSPRELRYENTRLAIDSLRLTARDSSLVVAGELPLSPRAAAGSLSIEAHANLATLTQYLPRDTSFTGDGAATLTGSLHGTLQSITPDLELTIENGVLLSPQLEPGASHIQLHARVADGAIAIKRLTGNWGAAAIDASGTIPFGVLPPLPVEIPRSGGVAAFKASVRNLDPAAIPGAPAGLTGDVSLDIDAAGARADIGALEGRIAFQELEVAFNRLSLTQQEPSRISIKAGVATVERLALSGSAGSVAATGTVGLFGERPLDLKVNGNLNVAALSALTPTLRTDGSAAWNLAAHGTVTAPELTGTFDLADATVASDELNVAAVDVNAHVDLAGTRLELTKLAGEINGGAFEGSGSATFANSTIGDVNLKLAAKDIAYDAPLNLRSLSDTAIHLSRRGDDFLLAGQVTIKEAGLTADINLDEGLFAAITAPRTLDLTEERSPLLERVRFNIDVDTATPVMVDNNLARAEIDADLRVVGTPYEPGLTGRLMLAEGGQLTLNARRYEAERGIITFVDERRIVPSFDLVLKTKASHYDIRIAVSGSPGKTETSWTSEPSLPEPDIMALLVTGRTLDEMRGEESEVAKVQAMSYLTGRVGSKFGRGLERATGLSEVRIEPVLIADETDPTARLTVGQNLTDRMKLVYSTNLADSNDQIWVVEYDVTRRFQTRGVRERDDDSYRFDFRHDVRFGGDLAPKRELRRRPTIASVSVEADAAIDETRIRQAFKLKPGDTYEFFTARSGVERAEKLYLESGYLQSRVRLDRQVGNDKADLRLRITTGPLVDLQFEGPTPPSDIREEVRTAWHHGVFDRQRGNDSLRVLRQWLMHDNHLQPRLEYHIEDTGERRHVVFRIQPGPQYDTVVLAFEGASGIDPDRLDSIVNDQQLERQLFTDPEAVTNLLERYYREQGYLSAEIEGPRYDFEGTSARIVLAVREGPRFQVKHVNVVGATVFASTEIAAQLPVVAGAPFLPAVVEQALERIRELYWRKGYNDMRSEYALVVDRSAGSVDVGFTIVEGRQSVIAEIAVEGHRKTSEHLVRDQIELSPSQPLDLAAVARSRRNLYSTAAFSIADVTREDLESDQPFKPVRLNVSVREVQPVQLRYGLSYDTDGGLGGLLNVSIHNSLGKARVLGLQARYDSEVRDGRVYLSQPSLRYWPPKTTFSVYVREDLNPPTEQTEPFDISRKGASIQQEVHFRNLYVWSYAYRYELATTLEPSLGEGVTETVRVSPLSTTFTRETRDEALDASKGTFLSQAFAYSPSWLGSDRPYLKYYGQYFYYFPLHTPKPKPFTSEVLRPRLVFATGVRIGLAHGLGGDVPTSERFYAGGSTTLRGFEQNAVGPIGENDVPAGGNAVLVLNNELRMPLIRFLDGVLFVDVGNVYPTIGNFSLSDLRESAGVGLRLRTRWLLLRADYGFVLDPRPGERRSRFYFNIGQAF